MAPQSKAGICAEKRRLTDTLLYAVRELQALHDREIEHIVSGGNGLDRLDLALKLARKRRDQAKGALLLHVGWHCC